MDKWFDFFETIWDVIFNPIFNSFGEVFYSNGIVRFFIIALFVSISILLVYISAYKTRHNIKIVVMIVLPFVIISLLVIGKLYERGYLIKNIKKDGLSVVTCLQEFYKANGRYPEDLSVLVPNCLNNEEVKNTDIFRYRIDKDGSYSLSIHPDYMTWEFLMYNKRTRHFEYTD